MFTNCKNIKNTKKKKIDFASRFYRLVSISALLLIVYCILMCILSFVGAIQDYEKFRALGRTKSFYSYLEDNGLWYNFAQFILVTVEFALYRLTNRRLEHRTPVKGSLWYYSAMLVIHAVAWLHANSLVQGYPFALEVGEFVLWYRAIADTCLWPVIGYCISYAMRFRKYKSDTVT